MLGLSGLAIGVFKTGALALIGDISTSTAQHTSIMNTAEGFFGVGAIIGPAILARLLGAGLSWTWLYAIAGTICVALIVLALLVKYPETTRPAADSGFSGTGRAMKSPYVLAFSAGAFLYVGVEAAVYVWMPTLLAGYTGSAAALATYSISIFFLLRAAGRFLGAWMLTRVPVAVGARAVQRLHPPVFRRQRRRWRELGGVSAPAVRAVHVGHLSDDQFERHQLPSEVRARCRRRRDPLLYLRISGARPAGDRRGERRVRSTSRTGSGWRPASRRCSSSVRCLNWLINPTRTRLEQLDASEYRQAIG